MIGRVAVPGCAAISCALPHRQRGFGGDGLGFMSWVGATGVMLAVALPAWQDYSVLSRVEDGIALANPARDAIANMFAEQGPADMALQASSKWTPPSPTDDVQSVSIDRGGAITVRFKQSIASADQNQIQIVPVAGGRALDLNDQANKGKSFQWQCAGEAGKSTLATRYVPSSCREGKVVVRSGSTEWGRFFSTTVFLIATIIPAWIGLAFAIHGVWNGSFADALGRKSRVLGLGTTAWGIRNLDFAFVSRRLARTQNRKERGAETRTWLHLAIGTDNMQMVELLLKHGAPSDAVDAQGRTALHHAVTNGNGEVIGVLLKFGASCSATDRAGRTPLHVVVNAETVHLLVNAGANPNVTDKFGNTPLHHVATGYRYDLRSSEIVKFLIERGADASRRNAKGQLPRDLAKPFDAKFEAMLAAHQKNAGAQAAE